MALAGTLIIVYLFYYHYRFFLDSAISMHTPSIQLCQMVHVIYDKQRIIRDYH